MGWKAAHLSQNAGKNCDSGCCGAGCGSPHANAGAHSKRRLKAIFIDRDGVMNRNIDKGYVTGWESFEFIPGSPEAVALIKKGGLLAVLITNQSCINRGLITSEGVDEIHRRMLAVVEKAGGRFDRIYICPHRPDEGCACRKPKPGLLVEAMRDFGLKPDEVLFVGDHDRDRGAAEAAGCAYEQTSDERGLLDIIKSVL